MSASTAAGEASDVRSVVVDKQLKVGVFAVALTDLVLPAPALPIAVTRSYDTRDGDFPQRGLSL